MSEQLPPYTTLLQPEPETSQYTLPETFNIGQCITQHLVRPDQLKAHLQLLAAFSHLEQRVVANESLAAGLESDSEKRWVWFVNLAVERWYAEDTTRISKLKPLAHFTNYFPNLLDNSDILTTDAPQYEPSLLGNAVRNHRVTHSNLLWFSHTNLLSALTVTALSFRPTIAFLQPNGKGYAQSDFHIECECAQPITKEVLGLFKFAKNIVETTVPDTYLAGTLHTPHSTYDIARGDTIKERVLDSNIIFQQNKASDRARQILINVQHDAVRMRTVLKKYLKPRLLNRMMGAYTDDRVFSLDLVGALRLQMFPESIVTTRRRKWGSGGSASHGGVSSKRRMQALLGA
ncbi:uncharacterized protein F5891DRAFT_1207483 [Suillus fuscotomentosus]|uniref:Uncharacterized protein n=1 Tax=Suillus fuscotomentosus TaxID=1912939 RepID=A0AAD4EE47_9AGAM|nr:uncharacterized protein F5891DRAFT_1207483 [Suillus fuscotomentosus]KAG1904445.1 hypothetical protein F5891DRAFT_1207483 [Suillus fuscotomentosus]